MRKIAMGILIAMSILFTAIAGAQPQVPDKPTAHIYVQDYANVLSPETETAIQEQGTKLYADTKAQVVVVTIESLEGESIKEYALEVLRKWGIGDKELNNGAVMLVVAGDHKARIEVGYGLEGALPDGKCGQILREKMTPKFKNEQYDAGVLAGYQAIEKNVVAEYGGEVAAGESEEEGILDWLYIIIGAIGLIGLPIWGLYFLWSLFFGKNNGNGSSNDTNSSSYSSSSYSSDNSSSDDDYGGGDGGGGGSDDSW